MVFKPKKTGGVVFGYSLKVPLVCSNQAATVIFFVAGFAGKVEDLSASCANTLPPWLSLFARWIPG